MRFAPPSGTHIPYNKRRGMVARLVSGTGSTAEDEWRRRDPYQ